MVSPASVGASGLASIGRVVALDAALELGRARSPAPPPAPAGRTPSSWGSGTRWFTENRNEWFSLGLNTNAPLGENWLSNRSPSSQRAAPPTARSCGDELVLHLAVDRVEVVAPVVVGQVHQRAAGVGLGVPDRRADDHPAPLPLKLPVGLALEVEDVAPLLDRQARLERELRLDRGPAVPVGEHVVAVGRHRDPGVGLDRLGHLHAADAGHEDLVLYLRGAAVHRQHRAVVEVVVQPAGAVAVDERVAVADRRRRQRSAV